VVLTLMEADTTMAEDKMTTLREKLVVIKIMIIRSHMDKIKTINVWVDRVDTIGTHHEQVDTTKTNNIRMNTIKTNNVDTTKTKEVLVN
jgi:hypothetical protein